VSEKSSLDQLSGQPVSITINGNQYQLSPLTLGDIAEFEKHLRDERLETFYANMAHYPLETQTQVSLRLLRGAFGLDDVFDNLASIAGARWILLRSLNKKHPALSETDLSLPLSALADVVNKLLLVSGLVTPEDVANPPAAGAEAGSAPTGEKS